MKLGIMKKALPVSLSEADKVFCYGEHLGWDAAEALAPMSQKACVLNDLQQLVQAVIAESKPGDHILVMSNGGFGGVHKKLLDGIQERQQA
jgi:UDP-N-acetylmuramate: L-alanyl-gamma-D-glutamyl-meso-diaminopimelate ligase